MGITMKLSSIKWGDGRRIKALRLRVIDPLQLNH